MLTLGFDRKKCSALALWALLWVLCGLVAFFQPPSYALEVPDSFAPIAKKVSSSVVNISATRIVESRKTVPFPFGTPFGSDDPMQEFFKRFFQDRFPKHFKQRSLGSGFIIDKNGFILTNNHVVEKTEAIEVTMSDGEKYPATVIGKDPKTDLALIQINVKNDIDPLHLADSDKLEVGDWVIAIGSPFGLGNTVTAGIVSAKYRRIGSALYEDFIQTDASINPGNSGGPLLNIDGEVVGINTAIFSRSGGNIGIGFAIPSNMIKTLLPQLKKGKVVRGWMGVMIQPVTKELKDKLGLKSEDGVLVSDVTDNGPADKAGIQRGDVILSFDGKKIEEMQDLPFMVATTKVGKEVEVVISRNGKKKVLELTVGEMKEETVSESPERDSDRPNLGLGVREITPEMAQQYGLSRESGVIVVQVNPNSPAAEAGLIPGDIILEIDRQPVPDLESFREKIEKFGEGDTILLLIKRKGATLFVALKLVEQ